MVKMFAGNLLKGGEVFTQLRVKPGRQVGESPKIEASKLGKSGGQKQKADRDCLQEVGEKIKMSGSGSLESGK